MQAKCRARESSTLTTSSSPLPPSSVLRPPFSSPPLPLLLLLAPLRWQKRIAHLVGVEPTTSWLQPLKESPTSRGSKPSALIHCAKGASVRSYLPGGAAKTVVTFFIFRAFIKDCSAKRGKRGKGKRGEKEKTRLFFFLSFRRLRKMIRSFFQNFNLRNSKFAALRPRARHARCAPSCVARRARRDGVPVQTAGQAQRRRQQAREQMGRLQHRRRRLRKRLLVPSLLRIRRTTRGTSRSARTSARASPG